MSNEYLCSRQVCSRRRGFQCGDTVILATETDPTRTGTFREYGEDRQYAWVVWDGNPARVRVPVRLIRHLEEWQEARAKQAGLANYWTRPA